MNYITRTGSDSKCTLELGTNFIAFVYLVFDKSKLIHFSLHPFNKVVCVFKRVLTNTMGHVDSENDFNTLVYYSGVCIQVSIVILCSGQVAEKTNSTVLAYGA